MKVKIIDIKTWVLCISFSFLFLTFYNFNDFTFLFLFQRIGLAFISILFLGFYFFKRKMPKDGIFLLVFFTVLILISAISSYIVFGQPILYGIVGEFKLLGVFYFFFALSLLKLVKPDIHNIERVFVTLAFLFLIVFSIVHSTLNPAHLFNKESNLVIKDSKGYRFKFQDIFIVIYFFYCLRLFLNNKRRFFGSVSMVLVLLYLYFFQQERAELLSILLVFGFLLIRKSHPAIKAIYILLIIGVISIVLINPFYYSIIIANVDTSSLHARQHTFDISYKFISNGITNLFFGAGNLNTLWQNGFQRLYGNNFFLSDIGWVGITYEFGLIGAFICIYCYFRVLQGTNRIATKYQSEILFAIKDYVLVRLILSVFSPHIPYFIGIYSTIMALNFYLLKYQQPLEDADYSGKMTKLGETCSESKIYQ